jgi:outer membrane protein OmpA-like peptidoglycan-associated protein
MKLQAFPISAVGWIHLAPEGPFYPYVYVGAGGLIYKRFKWGPVNDTQGKFKSSFQLPIGAGFESFLSRDISFSVDLDVRIMSDNTDGRAYRHFNGYATIKAGAEVYFGTSITEEEERARERVRQIEESSAAETRRLRELAEAEAQRLKAVADSEAQRHKDSVEAQRLAELKAFHPADTVIVLIRGKTLSLNGVNFAVGNATLTEDAKAKLRQVFNTLIASPEVKVLIVGHTDRVGNEAANKRLSLRRAQTVRSWLVKEGIPLKRLSVAGHGSDEPIDDDSTPEGRANNRRVEFRVLQ